MHARTLLASFVVSSLSVAACSGAGNGDLFGPSSPEQSASATEPESAAVGPGEGRPGPSDAPGDDDPPAVESDGAAVDDGGAGGDASSDGGAATRCTLPQPQCPAGQYCSVQGCGQQGTCAPIPSAASAVEQPVCGCNGVTYWNATVAARARMSVRMSGACAAGTPYLKTCDGETECPAGSSCSMLAAGAVACVTTRSGTCWAIPSECPAAAATFRRCGVGKQACFTRCDAIDREDKVYEDKSCP